jgi:ABC-type transport system involved in cytochrome c biogenesis permease subunit
MRAHLLAFAALLSLSLPSAVAAASQVADPHAGQDPHAGHDHAPAPERPVRTAPWDQEVVDLFARLPVQDGGRIKPLSTYAGFQLLRLNGKRSIETPAGEKLEATQWLMDVFFHPQQAATYPCFQVRNSAILHAANISTSGKKKSDRYSWRELEPGIEKLFELANRYSAIDSNQQTSEQRDTVLLAHNLSSFESLLHFLDFADHRFHTHGSEPLRRIYGGEQILGLSGVLARMQQLREHWMEVGESSDPEQAEARQGASILLSELERFSFQGRRAPALVPPDGDVAAHPEWLNPGAVVEAAFLGHPPVAHSLHVLEGLEGMVASLGRPADLRVQAQQTHDAAAGLAQVRGEYGKVPAEVSYYEFKFFSRALVLYLLGFLLVALTWLAGPRRWLTGSIWGVSVAATLLVVGGVAYRCYLRGRPPVTTLYETILFITGSIAILALFIEWVNRQRVALALTPIIGAMGMFLANKYELREAATAGDTMPSLVAVLDTNFWLATHVTAITLGYAAGLLAAAISHVWLLGKMFGIKRGNDAFFRTITRMVYGVLAFALVFSVVGTILGGIWANYSWGRFWGWDPKENGALLICLAQLFILHSRLGGYVKAHGVHVLTIFQGCVVAFSWWGVNQLGVGLHSYGFTEGIMRNLVIFWALEGLIVLASGAWAMGQKGRLEAAASQG